MKQVRKYALFLNALNTSSSRAGPTNGSTINGLRGRPAERRRRAAIEAEQ